MYPAFETAGAQNGLQIWRIENFEPVPYPKKDYGKFYTGDSYIVLFTEKNEKGDASCDIHYWLGNETTQDESGTAAILSVYLDDALGGGPVQHREVQEHESPQFIGYFKSGVRYMPGGVASGFKQVDINAPVEKALYQVKGKRNVRVRQVDPKVSSMHKGDCFILDTGRDIYVYIGAKSKGVERFKAAAVANLINIQDHAGRGKVTTLDEFSTSDEMAEFFQQLGGGSVSEVADEPEDDDDEQFEKNQNATVVLYRISDASGELTVVKVAEKPLKQDMLDTNDAFILDTVTSGIYVWIGKNSTNQEKVAALKKGQDFLLENNYPSWTKMVKVGELAEPAVFREYFENWTDTNGHRACSELRKH